jgi:hypothetical protein
MGTNAKVHPSVRALSWILGPAFLSVVVIGLVALVVAVVSGESLGAKGLITLVFLVLAAFSLGALLLRVAWTGLDPHHSIEDEEAGP